LQVKERTSVSRTIEGGS